MKILPHLEKFAKEVSVSSVSFNILKSSLVDNLLEVKLTFFYSLASELELCLTIFQCDPPMAPFLYDSLEDILIALVEKFVKSEVLQSIKEKLNVSQLDLDQQENLLTANNIRLVYAIRHVIKKDKLPEKAVMLLKNDVRRCLKVIVIKLQDNSPLKYKLAKGISCSCPSVALNTQLRKQCLKLSSNLWLSGPGADIIEQHMSWYVPWKILKPFFHHFLEKDALITCGFTFLRHVRFQLKVAS
ncbi:hypothetical protein PR048_013225 [Dryococelus australis]|uniref:Uncharacterized protein n=1 Tax=Dryococelus australis TaxID=614101 RepID=A0ABQ9HRK2_9NEOP|nr:hypothetical protein PR048_013225 [Dryococelus australis]